MNKRERARQERASREQSARRARLFAFLEGWQNAAGLLGFPREREHDADFLAGWIKGQAARKRATRAAEKSYGYKLAILRICGKELGRAT